MARIVRAALGVFLIAALPVGLAVGCSVEPVGADGCKKIETERCAQVSPCKNLKVTDITACQRFYRDQCLHGLALETEPGEPVIDRCVSAVKAAGACAKGSPDAPCVGLAVNRSGATACDVLEHPEFAVDCSFLVPPPPATATVTPVDAGPDATSD